MWKEGYDSGDFHIHMCGLHNSSFEYVIVRLCMPGDSLPILDKHYGIYICISAQSPQGSGHPPIRRPLTN